MTINTEEIRNQLIAELEAWCTANNYPHVSADEIEPRTPNDAKWLHAFIDRWEANEERER